MMFKNLMFSVAFSLVFSLSGSHAVKITGVNGEELPQSSSGTPPASPNSENKITPKTLKQKVSELNAVLLPQFNIPLMNQLLVLASPMNRIKGGKYLSNKDILSLIEAYPTLSPHFIREGNFRNSLFVGFDLKGNQDLAAEGLTRLDYDYFVKESEAQLDALIQNKKAHFSAQLIVQSAKSRIARRQLATYRMWKKGEFQKLMIAGYDAYKGVIADLKRTTPTTVHFFSFNTDVTTLPSRVLWNPLTNLTTLFLTHKQISNIEALAGLTGLQNLELKGNNISDIKPLNGLTGLQRLTLGDNNNIADLGALAGLTGLQTLELEGNNISDVTALGNLSGLLFLSLSYNELTNIESLATLTNLIALGLRNNDLHTLASISNMTRLQDLDLTDNPYLWLPMKKSRKLVNLEGCFRKYEAPKDSLARIKGNRNIVADIKANNFVVKGVPGTGIFEICGKIFGKDSNFLNTL